VGITSRSLEARVSEHISRANNGQRNNRLYQAFRKYGVDNFETAVLEYCRTEDETRTKETWWIEKRGYYDNGYNCNLGGCGNLDISDETRKKIGDGRRGIRHTPEARQKIRESKLGKPECANNFGSYAVKGNPGTQSKEWTIEFPDGHVETISGLKKFCQEYGLSYSSMTQHATHKGYKVLEKFIQKPERSFVTRAKEWTIQFPDGHEEVIKDLKKFCRDHDLYYVGTIRGGNKGYSILKKFRGHPEREYTQASGSGAHPVLTQDDDMVRSAWKHAAA